MSNDRSQIIQAKHTAAVTTETSSINNTIEKAGTACNSSQLDHTYRIMPAKNGNGNNKSHFQHQSPDQQAQISVVLKYKSYRRLLFFGTFILRSLESPVYFQPQL
jgi:hypothetical protein